MFKESSILNISIDIIFGDLSLASGKEKCNLRKYYKNCQYIYVY